MNEGTEKMRLPAKAQEILLENNRFLTLGSWAAIWVVIVLLINLLRLGGYRFVLIVDSVTAILSAAIAAALAEMVRQEYQDESPYDLIWLSIPVAFGTWSILEIFRLVDTSILSRAQFSALVWFWSLGYLPLAYGLYERYKLITDSPTPHQRNLILGCGGLGVLFILVTAMPALFSAGATGIAAAILSILYSIFDLALLVVTLRIIFTYQGYFPGPWVFFAGGFVLKIIGDAVLRYPGQLGSGAGFEKFLLSIVNFSHYCWYFLPALGMLVYKTLLTHKNVPPPNVQIKEEMTPNSNALAFTDKNDTVIRTSLNFRYLLRLPDEIATSQTHLRDLLGISESTYNELKTILNQQESLNKFVVEPSYLRKGQKAWITAAVSFDPQKKYNGADIVVQVLAEGVGGASLTSEERALAENIFWLTGSKGEDEFKLLTDYFDINYRMLSGVATRYEGSKRAAKLSELVNQAAAKQRLPVRVLEQSIMVTGKVKLEELGAAVSILLGAARGYVSNLAGLEYVLRETDRINQQMDRSTKKLIERYKLAK